MIIDAQSSGEYRVEFLPEEASYEPLSLCAETPFTQSSFYYHWQRAAGKKSKRFFVKNGAKIVAYAQCFFTPVRFLGGRGYWYAPYGPVCATAIDRERVAAAVKRAFLSQGNDSAPVFFRLDFFPPEASLEAHGARSLMAPCARFLMDGTIQPRSEWVLPLVSDEATLLAAMHQKTRYSIQYAQKKGVTVSIISSEYAGHVADFCHLMKQTAQRDGFAPHPDAYYEALFSQLSSTRQGFLTIGSYSGKTVAVALVIIYGKTATYVFGASSDEHRNVSAPALVQWAAIIEARRRGCVEYSFGGASSQRFPVKTWKGITAFKQRFGGHAKDYSPTIDLVFTSGWYRLFVARKWLRRYLHI